MPISKDYQTVICHTEKVGNKIKSQTRILMTWISDKPERIATRLVGVKALLSDEDWYALGMKYLRWRKNG